MAARARLVKLKRLMDARAYYGAFSFIQLPVVVCCVFGILQVVIR